MQPNSSVNQASTDVSSAGPARGKALRIAQWIVSILLAAEFAFASKPKLIGDEQAVQGFQKAGFPSWFLLFIGVAELAGAVGLLIPKLRFWAATGLSLIMIGAVVTHARNGDAIGQMAPALISLLLLLWLAWTTRPARLLPRA